MSQSNERPAAAPRALGDRSGDTHGNNAEV